MSHVAKVEIEIAEDGTIGTLPEPVQKFFTAKFNEAFGKGAEKTALEAKAQIDAATKALAEEKAKHNSDPASVEKVKTLELELSKMREAEAIREKNFEEAQKVRDERYAKELADRDKRAAESESLTKAEIEKRDARLRANVETDIKAEAIRAGVREASLDEVCELLAKYVLLDADFRPAVQAEVFRQRFSESKLGADGKPVAIESLVAEYLALKPHHKNPVKGTGPAGRGGASINGGHAAKGKDAEFAAAIDAVSEAPTIHAAASIIGRIRERGASQ